MFPQPAPFEKVRAAERVSSLPHLPYIVELERRLPPGTIHDVRHVQTVVDELFKRGIGWVILMSRSMLS